MPLDRLDVIGNTNHHLRGGVGVRATVHSVSTPALQLHFNCFRRAFWDRWGHHS